ncbi:uncharacterized protein LOC142352245 isoform X2 [Convolutriloba macropyga]
MTVTTVPTEISLEELLSGLLRLPGHKSKFPQKYQQQTQVRVISRNDRTTSDFREYASYISEYNTALEEQYFAPQPPSLPPSITVDREYSTSVPTEEKEEPEELQPFETPQVDDKLTDIIMTSGQHRVRPKTLPLAETPDTIDEIATKSSTVRRKRRESSGDYLVNKSGDEEHQHHHRHRHEHQRHSMKHRRHRSEGGRATEGSRIGEGLEEEENLRIKEKKNERRVTRVKKWRRRSTSTTVVAQPQPQSGDA